MQDDAWMVPKVFAQSVFEAEKGLLFTLAGKACSVPILAGCVSFLWGDLREMAIRLMCP